MSEIEIHRIGGNDERIWLWAVAVASVLGSCGCDYLAVVRYVAYVSGTEGGTVQGVSL